MRDAPRLIGPSNTVIQQARSYTGDVWPFYPTWKTVTCFGFASTCPGRSLAFMTIRRLCIAALLTLLAAMPARADPALWVAHRNGATVYLFGTIHVLPAKTRWMDSRIGAALAQSTELWTEADIGNLAANVAALRHYGLGAAQSTETLLPPDYRGRFRRDVALSGMPPLLFARARPWLAEILLDAAALQHAGPVVMGAESTLLAYAHDHHMATPTFETLDQQFAMLADMPDAAQITALEQEIDEFDGAGPEFAQLLTAWQAGDQDTLDRLTNQDMRKHQEASWTELILRRNEGFVQKIADRLQGSGTAFVAVGAAHLCGSTGVPALLKNQGYEVTRVQ